MDNLTKQKLKRLVSHSDWEVIYPFMAFIIERWNKQELKTDDQFNTLWNYAKRDGKIEGMKEFIDAVEKLALDSD